MKYEEILKKWGEKVSLISKRNLDEIEKHFIDSIFLLPLIEGNELADIGTGAGFPGIPVKIMIPEIILHLIERNRKKCIFLKNLVRELGLEKVIIYQKDWSNCFLSVDIAFAKAIGDVGNLFQEIHHIVKPNGKFILYSSTNEPEIGEPEIFSFYNPLRNSKNYLFVYRIGNGFQSTP